MTRSADTLNPTAACARSHIKGGHANGPRPLLGLRERGGRVSTSRYVTTMSKQFEMTLKTGQRWHDNC